MKKNRILLLIFCLAAGAAYLLTGSRNSPLYPMNEWVDVNCFFTMGRGMLEGLVPYRDLYEQKGPVLYFVYMLAALLSGDSFLGVYILETLAFSGYLYFCGRCAQVFREGFLPGALTAGICGYITASSCAFFMGGSAEEFCLCLAAYSLYAVLNAVHRAEPVPCRRAAAVGACAGLALFVKFTITGFFIGLCAAVALWCICRRAWRELFRTAGFFLIGLASVTAVVCGAFAACGALDDLIGVYFIDNLTLYPAEADNRLLLIVRCLRGTIRENRLMWTFISAGVIYLLFAGKKCAFAVLVTLAALIAGTYFGGKSWPYYGLIFAPFALFGCAAAADMAVRLLLVVGARRRTGWTALALTACLAVLLCRTGGNVWRMDADREELPQYRLARHIPEGATLLNYGFLDGGFYFASGAEPSCRFFCQLNIALDEMYAEQIRQLREGIPDYVVTRQKTLGDYGLEEGYAPVDSAGADYGEGMFDYYLYRREDRNE